MSVFLSRKLAMLTFLALVLGVILASGSDASAEPTPTSGGSGISGSNFGSPTAPRSAPQGVAVLAVGSRAHDDAFGLARATYGSSLRPRSLDELRARILAGDPAPPTASKDVRELAELRGSIHDESAASRRLLASIARDLNVQALLVVTRREATGDKESAAADSTDGGTDSGSEAKTESDGGLKGPSPQSAVPTDIVVARLFLADTGDFDAARYEADKSGWKSTVASLLSRFPAPAPVAEPQGPAPRITTEGKPDAKPFYASPWLWAAVGAAVLIGGFFYFAAQDTSKDPIHLQMTVPR